MSDTDTVSTAVEAWMAGDMQGAQALNQPIPDDAAVTTTDEPVPSWIPKPSSEAAAPAVQTDVAMVQNAATKLTELGTEGAALVREWGGHTSPSFTENLSYAKAAFADIAKNRPDLIAKVDASGLGNDPAVLKVLSELGRQRAHTMGDTQRNQATERQRPMPESQTAAQRELAKIYKDTPPGSPGYREKAVQDRVRQLNEMIHGTEPVIGQGGRTV